MREINKPIDTAMAPAANIRAELQRQCHLIDAIFSAHAPTEPAPELGIRQYGTLWSAGIAAYRGNGLAHATAALRVQFPTLLAMLGDSAFDAVCVRHWRSRPPRQGDLAKIGAEFADTIAGLSELAPWPWLADSAKLDSALWQVLFDAPSRFNEADLQHLVNHEPVHLRIHLAPGTRLIQSPWPLFTLRQLHCSPEPNINALQDALQRSGESVWIWREGYEAKCCVIPEYEVLWMHALQTCASLDAALDVAPNELDFAGWLNRAVQHGWIDYIEVI